jgi:hypothetical protein
MWADRGIQSSRLTSRLLSMRYPENDGDFARRLAVVLRIAMMHPGYLQLHIGSKVDAARRGCPVVWDFDAKLYAIRKIRISPNEEYMLRSNHVDYEMVS